MLCILPLSAFHFRDKDTIVLVVMFAARRGSIGVVTRKKITQGEKQDLCFG